ncbi:MAG: hypothetical protein ACLFV6_13315 [Spirulinaceae cyanobacterium]
MKIHKPIGNCNDFRQKLAVHCGFLLPTLATIVPGWSRSRLCVRPPLALSRFGGTNEIQMLKYRNDRKI